ncbi:YetF domain-containing protein [Bacillus sp. SCS-153A]|uniref:YetF domain-containing protein n=1 Tax=Rossellomorea sedimentorum TaxID=3115294 RepID=UPI003905C1DF
MDALEVLLRVVITFVGLFLVARISGRKEISQMTYFNLISAIALGSIGGAIISSANFSIRNGILALSGWLILTLLFGYMDIKSKGARKIIEGEPIIVIKQGKIMEKALSRTRLDVDALLVKLREKNVFSVSEVDYAIFETDGKLSVMKKQAQQPLTKKEMNIPYKHLLYPQTTEVIANGKVIENNLKKLNLKEEWLKQQLRQNGIGSVSEVFYAEVQKDGSLYIDTRHDNMTH